MAETATSAPGEGLPRVPAGSAPPQPVVAPNTAGAPAGNGNGVVPKPPFGGNVGKKPVALPAGMVKGTPEHDQWLRDKEAERKRAARAVARTLQQPPPLPSSSAPLSPSLDSPLPTPGGPVLGDVVPPVVDWTAKDFDGCAPEVVELLEAAIVEYNTQLAASGGLPEKVVRKISADSAFPRSSKDSLRRTSPDMLAKFANAIRLPVTLKPYVSGIPALFVIGFGQWKMVREIHRLIDDDKKLRSPAPSPALTVQPAPVPALTVQPAPAKPADTSALPPVTDLAVIGNK